MLKDLTIILLRCLMQKGISKHVFVLIFYSKDLLKIIWKNGSFRNRENLQLKKTADSVLLNLFMRTNGKCNISYAP